MRILWVLLLAGCCQGHVDADAIRPLVDIVTRRHDSYVREDDNLSDRRKTRYLRSAALLRRVVDVAPVSS